MELVGEIFGNWQEVVSQDGIEIVVDPGAVEDEIPSELPLSVESHPLQDLLRRHIVDCAASLDSLEFCLQEKLGQQLGQSQRHQSTLLKLCRQCIADLGQAMLPVCNHECDPTSGLIIGADDPLELLAMSSVDIADSLAFELVTELPRCCHPDRLVFPHTRFCAPSLEERSISGLRRSQSDHFGQKRFVEKSHALVPVLELSSSSFFEVPGSAKEKPAGTIERSVIYT